MKHLIGQSIKASCPECDDGYLVVRQNQRTHVYFIGCSCWPECDFSTKLPEDTRMKLLGAPTLPLFNDERNGPTKS